MRQRPESPPKYFTNEYEAEVGKKIRGIRGQLSLTRKEVAERMGSDDSTVYRMEQGRSLTLPNLIHLCQALDCTMEELIPDAFKHLASRSNKGISMMPTETLTLLSAVLNAEQQHREVA